MCTHTHTHPKRMSFEYSCAICIPDRSLFFHHIGTSPRHFPETSMNQHHLAAACLPLRPLLFFNPLLTLFKRSHQRETTVTDRAINCHPSCSFIPPFASLIPVFFHSPLPPLPLAVLCLNALFFGFFFPSPLYPLIPTREAIQNRIVSRKKIRQQRNKVKQDTAKKTFAIFIFTFFLGLMLFIHFYVFSSNT